MKYGQLDKMIEYIENNLIEPIDDLKLSKIVGLPPYILQRVFQFITGMTIIEYIRKRRLSKAYEYLIRNEKNVTELAFLYGYSSTSSFSRAFKQCFGILPSQVKKEKEIITFPRIIFEQNMVDTENLSYEINTIEQMELYGRKCAIDDENYISQIYQFYNELEQSNLLQKLKRGTWYGLTIIEKDKEFYFVGSTKYDSKLEKLKIPKIQCMISKESFISQKEIAREEIKMIHSLIPATDYEHCKNTKLYEIEIYNIDQCQIAIPIS